MKDFLKIFFLLTVFASAFALPKLFIFAQEQLSDICQIQRIEASCNNSDPSQCRELLEKCDEYYKQEAAKISQDLSKTEKEKQTLQNKVSSLRKQIQNLEYQIYQSNLMIGDLGVQIKDTEVSINKTSLHIDDIKDKLSSVIRKINEEDNRSLVEVMLSEGLSEFFDNLVSYESLSFETQALLEDIKSLKDTLENQKQSLDSDKGNLEDQVYLQTLQKNQNSDLKTQQEYYLKITEAEYQKQLAEKQKIEIAAAEIRSRLFELIGVPEGGIEFGKAVEIALYVERTTEVRAAFLLSILAQESMNQGKIGANVGQCYLQNTNTGDGIYIKSGKTAQRTMNPTRDIPPFLEIIEELNRAKGLVRDPFGTPVSCWIAAYSYGKPYGWGGAMGPAQFIPSTWVRYDDRISGITGIAADPWDIKDAFVAAGLYLKDLGAENNEFKAAMKYFSGSSWTWAEEQSYGNPVIQRAKQYQEEINLLSQ
ncbi:MAG: hypothetical protein HYW69_02600 [Candidatus Nealsonbacteria bacterium]|nr:hypothetical protein [Candidatus Nealsonbacteria bacterium]